MRDESAGFFFARNTTNIFLFDFVAIDTASGSHTIRFHSYGFRAAFAKIFLKPQMPKEIEYVLLFIAFIMSKANFAA